MSQKITDQEIIKVARLAKLYENPGEDFITKFGSDLTSVLSYVEELSEVDVSGVDPLASSRTIGLAGLREDEPDSDTQNYQRVRSNIIQNFPKKQGNLLVVSNIFHS